MPALRIRVFGGLSVENRGTQLAPAARQPKRLALLAIIACSGSQGVTRDHLIAYLWPESDETRSRNALNQALFGIRRDLLNEEVIEGREILRLNPAVVTSDVGEFEAALSSGRPEQAVELYRGPLLMGVHLREGREFGEWLERERATFLRRYRGALQELISRSRRLGEFADSVKRARQLVDSDPYDAGAVRQLLEVLLAGGDRPGAVLAAESYCRRVTRDLRLDPDPSVLAHLASLGAQLPNHVTVPPDTVVSSIIPAPGHRPALDTGVATDHSPGSRSKPKAHWKLAGLLLVAAGALSLAVVVVNTFRHRTPPNVRQGTSIVVLPFDVHGDSINGYLSDGMARLVANGLDGVGPVRAGVYAGADSLVRRARAKSDSADLLSHRFQLDRYITGQVIALGGHVEVRAVLHDASRAGRVLGGASAQGINDSVFALAESISRQLLGIEPTAGGGALIRGASDATASLAAFQAFVEGEAYFRTSRFADAVASFQRAIKDDPTFALAYYRLTVAADWNAQGELIPAAAKAALRLADRLSWRERMLLEGSVAWREGHNGVAESRLREITARYPNDAESWFQLAEVLFHSNPIRGRSFLESRIPFERVTVLDPASRGALSHLARIHAYLGDARGADSLLRAAEALMARGADPELRMFHATVSGDAAARELAITRLAQEPQWVGQGAASRIASYDQDIGLADSILRRVALSGGNANADFILLHTMFAAARGQFGRALEQASALAETMPSSGVEVRALLLSLQCAPYSAKDRREVVRQLNRSATSADRTTDGSWALHLGLERPVRGYLLGLLAARDRDTIQLRRYVGAVDAVNLPGSRGDVVRDFAAGLRAHLLALEGDPAGALRELARAPDPGDQSMQAQLLVNQLPERFLRATLLEQVGRRDEALGVYESLIFGGSTELLLAAPAALQRARLLARLGRDEAARLDYETFLHTWKEADVGVRPVVDSARRELASLSASTPRK